MKIKPSKLTIDNKNYSIYRMDFHSLTDLEMYLDGNPKVNRDVFSVQKSVDMPVSFAGEPLEKAIQYCHGGYENGFELFLQMKKELEHANVKYEYFRRSVPAVVGSRPHVPNFVAGTPKTMYRLDRVKEKKFVDIYINLVYSGVTTQEQIVNRGILSLNLISLFEQHSIGVNLYAFEASYMANEIFIAEIKLKKPGQSLNVGKCYYPLCGREFIRRLLVRVKESMPFQENWGRGYGSVLPEALLKKCMNIGDNTILIRSPIEMGLKGKNIYEDADTFFEQLHLSKEIQVPKYSDYRNRLAEAGK
ncbi:MAG: hypothetical protein J6N53_10705 [Lachnospiraceae bacterium]|nr:hypothetical protein [Lachnospiraceae bacterium]MBP3297512.1 hypothetical protein [Lachnospiraceae bacterium]